MTTRLYYNDAYTTKFAARLLEKTEIEGQPAVILDSTYFYPTGGGQPHDTGQINQQAVLDVITRPEDQAILHVLQQLPEGEHLTGEVNWSRRFDHMQQHTGQHILSRAFIEVLDAETVGFHLTENSLTIDVEAPDVPLTDLDSIENLANQVIIENRPVRAWFPEPEELAALPLRKVSEKVSGEVRVVDVGGFDICGCGGTHVAHTGEIGLIKVVKVEKAKKITRVEFRCGGRAIADYRQKNALLLNLAGDLTVGYWEVPAALERLRNENKGLQKELRTARTQLAQYEAEALWTQAAQAGGTKVVIAAVLEDKEPADLNTMVGLLTQKPNTVALLGVYGEKAHLVFGSSADTGVDVVPLLKIALEKLGSGKGGGRPTIAQGGGIPATREQVSAALAVAQGQLPA